MADARAAAPPLKHGLTSRWLFEAMQEEVEDLSELLIGASPPSPRSFRRRVRAMKTHVLSAAEMYREMSKNALAMLGGAGGRSRGVARKAGDAAELAMLSFLGREGKLLQRLDEYERRALSQRAETIRELNLPRIEAERRRLSRSHVNTQRERGSRSTLPGSIGSLWVLLPVCLLRLLSRCRA